MQKIVRCSPGWPCSVAHIQMRVSVINAGLGLGDGGTAAHDKAGRVSVPRMRAPYKCDPLR
jgi:hypothetical protein